MSKCKKKAKMFNIDNSTFTSNDNKVGTINMNEVNLKKNYIATNFKTGAHKTIKDRPRDKNWRKWNEN